MRERSASILLAMGPATAQARRSFRMIVKEVPHDPVRW
jgi:Ni,Fe-hydrogenase III small subunit